MIELNNNIVLKTLELLGNRIRLINKNFRPDHSSPVFTIKSKYTAGGWTEWTQDFQFSSEILQFDAAHDPEFLEIGREHTRQHMSPHIIHIDIHDHGFNNMRT